MAQIRRLVIEIDPIHSRELTAHGIRLVLAQPAGNAPPNLAWLVLPPAPITTVDWDERCGLYAGDVTAQDDPVIAVRSAVHPALDGRAYAFDGGTFALLPEAHRIPHGHYDVINESPFAAVFGLLGEAVVNGETVRAPANTIVLPPAFRASFAAAARVYVWLQPDVAGGRAAFALPAGAVLATFERDHTIWRCRYDRTTRDLISA